MWQKILQTNLRSAKELLSFVQMAPNEVLLTPDFPVNVPLRLAQKMEPGNPKDPLLLQFLPLQEESVTQPGFCTNPVGDLGARTTDRLLQKYAKRALLVTTQACAMHCRYCFRKDYPYKKTKDRFDEEIQAIQNDPSLEEILLSGGDPLSLSNRALKELFEKLSAIPHIKRIRIHTRFPIGIPERIDQDFVKLLEACPKTVVIAFHVNHPKELDQEVVASFQRLRKSALLLSQTVLLRDINDSVSTLSTLFTDLLEASVLPYYLFQLDRVVGTHHFEVSKEKGLQLMETLQQQLPGYAVPKYVQEIENDPYKAPVRATTASKEQGGALHPGHPLSVIK